VPPGVRLPLFFAITIVAVGAVLSFIRKTAPHERWLVGALGGIIGGALGNLVCRVRYGEVIDFLDVHWETLYACVNPAACRWPAFNIADSAITVGVAIVLLHGLRHGQEADRPAASAGR
jgi:signal peptidase II